MSSGKGALGFTLIAIGDKLANEDRWVSALVERSSVHTQTPLVGLEITGGLRDDLPSRKYFVQGRRSIEPNRLLDDCLSMQHGDLAE